MGKAELFENPVLDTILRQLGGFPVQRGSRDEWAIRHAQQVIEHGQVLGIFPEGKRNHGRGLRAGKTGAARLAIANDCPIVPLAVNGTQRLFKGGLQRLPVTITHGWPILPRPHESAFALTDRLMFDLSRMLPPEQRGVYALHPPGF
jgi:1-acyl-sn-glycerol-3-phosphate acyltransferase